MPSGGRRLCNGMTLSRAPSAHWPNVRFGKKLGCPVVLYRHWSCICMLHKAHYRNKPLLRGSEAANAVQQLPAPQLPSSSSMESD